MGVWAEEKLDMPRTPGRTTFECLIGNAFKVFLRDHAVAHKIVDLQKVQQIVITIQVGRFFEGGKRQVVLAG